MGELGLEKLIPIDHRHIFMKSVPEDLKDVLNQHDFGLNYINTVRAKRGAVKLLKALKDPSTKAKYVQN